MWGENRNWVHAEADEDEGCDESGGGREGGVDVRGL